tara:strand:+ start:662 stop:1042 length:381 start_codon:yes stop_codon:yes gene_type:complete
MKLSHYYKKLIFIIISTFCVFDVMAKQDIDDRVKKLTLELRCMTCQNQSIYDSEAEFSNDIKKIVKNKFEQGKTEKEIKEYLVNRYGEYILFKPLLNYKNMFLWVFPFILLAISLFFIIFRIQKNK